MAVPVFTVGQVIGAADVNSWFVPIVAYKPAATNRANTTVRANDPDLIVQLAANAVYSITLYAGYTTGATSGIGFAFGWSPPSGSTGRWGAVYRLGGDAGTTSNAGPAGTPDFQWSEFAATGGTWAPASTPGDSKNHCVMIEGTIITSSTASGLAFNWAQDVSNGTNLTLSLGSKLIAQRIG